MTEALRDLSDMITAARPDDVDTTTITNGELTVTATLTGLHSLIAHLRDHAPCGFTTLIDITAIDYPDREERFDLVYHFLSMRQNHRIRVRARCGEDSVARSICDLFPSANWYEREVFDMYGILFSGHPDLRRILTDYGFRGYPLRKDFPTTGYTEVRYDETAKRVVYEPVALVQEYRLFDFMSPWEGADYILPGDEKTKGA
jgi:NADH-quinone oxidoreductase subunit C